MRGKSLKQIVNDGIKWADLRELCFHVPTRGFYTPFFFLDRGNYEHQMVAVNGNRYSEKTTNADPRQLVHPSQLQSVCPCYDEAVCLGATEEIINSSLPAVKILVIKSRTNIVRQLLADGYEFCRDGVWRDSEDPSDFMFTPEMFEFCGEAPDPAYKWRDRWLKEEVVY